MEAGIDEAGRGCLAGPVVAGAVILPPDFDLPGLTDSKKLSSRRRAVLAQAIKAQAVSWALGFSWPGEIDRINILQATLKAMARALNALQVSPELVLVDGNNHVIRLGVEFFYSKRYRRAVELLGRIRDRKSVV